MISDFQLTLTEQSAIPSFVYDLKAENFIYGNASFQGLLAVDFKNANLNDLKKLIHKDDYEYVHKSAAELLNGTLKTEIEFRVYSVDEKEQWLRVTPSLGKGDDNSHLIFGNVMDITVDKINGETFKKYANKKDSILNILAHDLAGPLGFIKPLISSLRKKIDNADAIKQLDMIEKINSQAYNLIKDLTAREFLDTVDVVLLRKRIDISRKLTEYIEEYQKASESMDRVFAFQSSPESIFLEVDEAKVIQVINNLITNALKFTHGGGIIKLSVEEKDSSVVFSVSDNGIGIPEQYHNVLFEKFTNARRKGLQGEPTTGVGMSVVKTIVDWHEGKVWFDSKENEGTTVFFELPKRVNGLATVGQN